MAVVEGSSTVRVTEDAVAAATTAGAVVVLGTGTPTGVIIETEAKMASDAAEASERRAGKEIASDILPSSQGRTGITESEEEYDNFCSDFFGSSPIVGSSALVSRTRVPHPKDIPGDKNIFDDARLEKVWWERVREIDELRNSSFVVSSFARKAMDVSTF